MTRLRRSNPNRPGLTRCRRGRGFSYRDAEGQVVRDPEVIDRIKALVIPPAWQEVWICADPRGHLQAVGIDDAGRKQYLYHPAWRDRRDAQKFDRVLALTARLSTAREKISELIAGSTLGRERVLSAAVRMLELGAFRVGGHVYAKDNGSYGLATLLRDHVELRRGRIHVCYLAKGGQRREIALQDSELFAVLRSLLRRKDPNPELLAYRNGRSWHNVRAEDINDFLHELIGDSFSAKDLRTWQATVLATVLLAEKDRPETKTGRKRVVTSMIKEVAEELGNTPAACRRSYIDPYVIAAYEHGRTIRGTLQRLNPADLTSPEVRDRIEQSVRRLLRRARREIGEREPWAS